MNIQDLHEKKN